MKYYFLACNNIYTLPIKQKGGMLALLIFYDDRKSYFSAKQFFTIWWSSVSLLI
jgi:hypothetical protein